MAMSDSSASNQSEDTQDAASQSNRKWIRTLGRIARYLAIRVTTIAITVVIGVYAAIWVTNLGGYADEERRQEIEYNVTLGFVTQLGFQLKELSSEDRAAVIKRAVDSAIRAADLEQPFLVRSFRYLREAFGKRGRHTMSYLMPAVLRTLAVFGVANLITFFVSLSLAMALSQRYGSRLDRMASLVVPALAAPSWFHGICLIVIFAAIIKILPFGDWVGPDLPETSFGYAMNVLKHMILPISALVLGTMPVAVYANRALFLIHSQDDYVELAKAKGLGARRLQWRYILRPVLPAIITNYSLVMIVAWQEIILLETVFNWPGVGTRLLAAIKHSSVSTVIAMVTMLAYLLGFTVLLLDIVYVLVDPRVRFGAGGRA